MGRTHHLTTKDLRRLSKRYLATKHIRGQWELLKTEFGYKSITGLYRAMKKAGVEFSK